MRILSCLIIVFLSIHTCLSQADKYTDENRPYKFGFNIEGYQHRQEEKDEKGLIKGEYGFITADGYYRVTVYATDENGDFRIISMKNIYVGFPPEDPQTTPQPPTRFGSGHQPSSRSGSLPPPIPLKAPVDSQQNPPRRQNEPVQLNGLTACSDCLIPTTKKPGVGTRFGNSGGGGGNGLSFGTRTQGKGEQVFSGEFGLGAPGSGTRGNAGGRDGSGGGRVTDGAFQGRPGDGGTPLNSRGGARFPGSADGNRRTTGRNPGQLQNSSPNLGGGGVGGRGRVGGVGGTFASDRGGGGSGRGGVGGTFASDRGPELGSVRDGLPRGVSVDDIKALLYTFNYTVGFHGHHEDGYRNGDKEGDYFFDGRDGVERKVEYIANEFGYQPNITFIDLSENDVRTPKEQTEKEYGLKGYEFKWFYRK